MLRVPAAVLASLFCGFPWPALAVRRSPIIQERHKPHEAADGATSIRGLTFASHQQTGTMLASQIANHCLRGVVDVELEGRWTGKRLGQNKVVHFVRNPTGMVASGYMANKHALASAESARGLAKDILGHDLNLLEQVSANETYQEFLQRVPQHTGLQAEISRLIGWRSSTPTTSESEIPAVQLGTANAKCKSEPALCTQVCLEDFVADYKGTWEYVLDFAGLKVDEPLRECLQRFELANLIPRAPVNGSVAEEQRLLEREVASLDRLHYNNSLQKLPQELSSCGKVLYERHSTSGGGYCAGHALFKGPSAGKADCQAMCSKSDRCQFFSIWFDRKQQWCSLMASCSFVQRALGVEIVVYRKREYDVWDRLRAQEVAFAERSASGAFSTLAALDEAEQAFAVQVQRESPAEALGLSVGLSNGDALEILDVYPGPCERWSARNPEKGLKAGDVIVSVNGVSGNPSVMLAQLNTGSTFELLVKPLVQDESSAQAAQQLWRRRRLRQASTDDLESPPLLAEAPPAGARSAMVAQVAPAVPRLAQGIAGMRVVQASSEELGTRSEPSGPFLPPANEPAPAAVDLLPQAPFPAPAPPAKSFVDPHKPKVATSSSTPKAEVASSPLALPTTTSSGGILGSDITGAHGLADINCIIGAWSDWSECGFLSDGTLNGGFVKGRVQTRTREIVQQTREGGAPCPGLDRRFEMSHCEAADGQSATADPAP